MGLLQQITDRYNRNARLLPAALMVLPVFVLALTAIPAAVTVWTKVAGLAAFCLPFVASQVVRDRGLRVEPQLLRAWGGRPSENMLRWRAASTKSAVARRHQLVAAHLGIALPDETTEAADPADADELYATATAALRERTRDRSRFPLVFEENIAYGFRRNAYACRMPAILICALAALVMMALAWLSLVPLGWKQQTGLISFDALAAVGWWRLCTQAAVRRAAEKYAGQLFLSLEILGTEPQQTQPDPT